MVNVKWVDEFETHVNKKEVIQDYITEEIKVKDILNKHNLTMNEFIRIRDNGTDYRRTGSRKTRGTPKNYHYSSSSDVYRVTKTINKQHIFFGDYVSEEDAQKVVEYLRKHNWNDEGLKDFEHKHNICTRKKGKKHHYYNDGKRFRVYKNINGKRIYFGAYDSPTTAESIVEKLEEVNWDKTQLNRIQKEVRE